jgi:hypothetical protein
MRLTKPFSGATQGSVANFLGAERSAGAEHNYAARTAKWE